MTITNQTSTITYSGNGVTTNFPFAFRLDAEEELVVTQITVADDTEVVMSTGAYSVNGVGVEGGGSIDITPALSALYQVRLDRAVPYTQEVDIHNQGAFLPEVIEEGLDRLEMQIQQIKTIALGAGSATIITTGVADFDTKALAAAATIGAGINFLRIAGHTLVGDGGAALYVKVISEPAHPGKINSVDGAWWELEESDPTPQMFGAKGDGTTDDTTAFSNLFLYSVSCYWPAATYVISTLAIPANARVRTAGFSTIIQQKSGQAVGTRILTIAVSNIELALEGIKFIGNITTDTDEQNHCIFLRGVADFSNIKIGDVIGEDIRGDVVYIGGITASEIHGVSVGNVVGNNVLRNVISITGGEQISIGHISGDAVGYTMIDVEPDPGAHKPNQIFVRSVKGHAVAAVGPSLQTRVGAVHFGQLDLSPDYTADSTPAYGHRATITLDAVGLRNAENVKIDFLKARNFNRCASFVIWNVGEYGVGTFEIGCIDIENCILTDVTYNSLFLVGPVRHFKIGGGYARVNAATQRLILAESSGIASTVKSYTTLDITCAFNSILAYGAKKGRLCVQVNPAAGRNLHTVNYASTGNETIATLANGSSFDGATLATNQLVLLKDQSTGSQNGIYRINASGPATRSTLADAAAEFVNSYVYVLAGTANAGKFFKCTNATDPVVGTTAITYAEDVIFDAYVFNNCRDLVIEGSDIILGRAGLDCTNLSIIGTTWVTKHVSIVFNQSTLTNGELHSLISSVFNGVDYALGVYSRTYLRPALVAGLTSQWTDASGDVKTHTARPTADADGTVVGTQT